MRRRSVEFCKRYKWEGEREDIIAGEMEVKSGKREVDMTGEVLQDGEAQYIYEGGETWLCAEHGKATEERGL